LNLEDAIKKHLVNQIAGITVHYSKSDEYAISFVLLKYVKGKVKIEQSASGIMNLENLAEILDKNIPIWLTVTGRPVISRKLSTDPGENYLHLILHNARETEFTVSLVKESTGEIFASAIRKENLNILVDEFHRFGYKILGYSIGPALVSILYTSGLLNKEKISVSGYHILYKHDSLFEIQARDSNVIESCLIGTDRIDSDLVLPFAAALAYLINKSGFDSLVTESPSTDAESILYSKFNRTFILGSLAAVFGLLLINFLVFNYFSKKEQILTTTLSYQNTVFAESDSLRKEITLKKNLIDQMGLSQNTTYGYFADRIAASVPKGIILSSMAINPPTSKIKTDKPIQFEKLIRIKGETNGSMLLNEWVKALGKYNWIKNIEIIGYEKLEDKGEFEININYK